MKQAKKPIHPKVKAVAATGTIVSIIVGLAAQYLHFSPTPFEVAVLTTGVAAFGGWLKKAVGTGY